MKRFACIAILLSLTACAETAKERQMHAMIMPKQETCFTQAFADLEAGMRH